MKILGIDTSTKFLSLGAYDGAKVYEYDMDLGTRHSSLLVPTIKRILDALGWRGSEVDYFACGLGPGSFTGLRVGVATIKGLSWSVNKPVVAVSTLDILAKAIIADDALAAVIIDAKRQLTYCCVYRIKAGTLKKITPYMLLSEEELFRKIKDVDIITGDAVNLYREKILVNIKGVKILDRDCFYPKGHSIIELALTGIKEGRFFDSFNIKPLYLYPKECQIKSQNPR